MKKIKTWKNKTVKMDHLEFLINDKKSIPIDYNRALDHKVGDFISHFVFGLGFIQRKIDENKIEVFFKDYEKILLQNWTLEI